MTSLVSYRPRIISPLNIKQIHRVPHFYPKGPAPTRVACNFFPLGSRLTSSTKPPPHLPLFPLLANRPTTDRFLLSFAFRSIASSPCSTSRCSFSSSASLLSPAYPLLWPLLPRLPLSTLGTAKLYGVRSLVFARLVLNFSFFFLFLFFFFSLEKWNYSEVH